MYTIEQLKGILKDALNRHEYTLEPHSLYEPIKYMLTDGGKMIRPLLCLIAYNIYRDDVEKAVKPATGIEIFHNYTLLHDDVMDDAPLRRGRPTVHKKWNTNVAILSGDAAAIIAYKHIEHCEDQYLRRAIDGFNQVAMDVCRGQQYDMEFETRNNVTEEEYLNMIYLKTAVLLAGSLRHGALIAGAPEEECNMLYEFGGLLGLLFQLQDDYLDVYGNVEEFGKNIGGDILENKKTYMLIKALEVAGDEDGKALREWIEKKEVDPVEKIQAITEIYNRVNMPEIARRKIDSYLKRCKTVLAGIPVPEEKKQVLYEVVTFIDNRKK